LRNGASLEKHSDTVRHLDRELAENLPSLTLRDIDKEHGFPSLAPREDLPAARAFFTQSEPDGRHLK